MNRILFSDLIVTQNKLRHPVRALTVMDLGDKPIVLTKTEDDKLYVHDGHHRLVGLWKSGVRALDAAYFKVKEYTYEDLMSINLEVGWVTPIDFRTHCRRPDLAEYKDYILSNENQCYHYKDRSKIMEACMRNRIAELAPWYKVKRLITKIEELRYE